MTFTINHSRLSHFDFDRLSRYSMFPNNETYFPGPTLLVSKDCNISITFVNNLGFGEHLFPIDTTVDCGPNAPNCTATNGSQRRTTTQYVSYV